MDEILILARTFNEYGLWDFLSVAIQALLVAFGLVYFSRRRRVPNLNFTFALVDGEIKDRTHSSRQLTILVRNLSGMDVLLGAACFVTHARSAISEYADGDAASNEYELKFRINDREMFSNAFTLIKSTQHTTTWVPVNESMEPQAVIAAVESTMFKRSFIRCQVILLTKRPEIIKCKIPVINIQYRPGGLYFVTTNKPSPDR